jgi:hypothetical protein
MNDIRSRSLQRFDLVVAEMNAVSEGNVTTGQANAFEICDVPESTLLLDELAFGAIL